MLKLVYVGGLGMMAGPAAKHLTPADTARVLRIHDRGSRGAMRDQFRAAWTEHGAERVSDLDRLVGDGGIDGAVVCAGKNGDDLPLIAGLTRLMAERCHQDPFILHLSTVSPEFAEAAERHCREQGVSYANYPLTGGPLGAQLGGADPKGMLILASGDEVLYRRVEPLLKRLGHPRFFGPAAGAGAVTKLLGHSLVFNGLMGISSGTVIHAEYFNEGRIGGDEQSRYLQFLNGGAGGTRQWEVAMSKGVIEDDWQSGFGAQHAVVDAIYLANLMRQLGLPRLAIQSIIHVALCFSYILNRYPQQVLATHAIVREMVRQSASEIDAFMTQQGAYDEDLQSAINRCIKSLPEHLQKTVLLSPGVEDFTRCSDT